jgi:DNA-binding MarR family transcriptional regulator
MPSYSEDPVKHVISFRVNDHEKECLYEVARSLGINISILLRESVTLLTQVRDSQSRIDHLLPNRQALVAGKIRSIPGNEFTAACSTKATENALAILEALSEADGIIRITRLSESLCMNELSVVRLLSTFEQRGYVVKSENPGKYVRELAAYEVGQKFLSRMDLLKKARPAMKRLARQCNTGTDPVGF